MKKDSWHPIITIDVESEDRFIQQMGDSIEAALTRAQQSDDYLNNAMGKYIDEIAMQNLEQEAIYKQGYVDCLVHLIGVDAVKEG